MLAVLRWLFPGDTLNLKTLAITGIGKWNSWYAVAERRHLTSMLLLLLYYMVHMLFKDAQLLFPPIEHGIVDRILPQGPVLTVRVSARQC